MKKQGVFVVVTLALAIGCASPRSNTRKADETKHVVIVSDLDPKQKLDHAGLEAMAVDLAVKAGVQLAKQLINTEAKKYEADYSAEKTKVVNGFKRPGGDGLTPDWVADKTSVLLFMRSISNPPKRHQNLLTVDLSKDDHWEKVVANAVDLVGPRLEDADALRKALIAEQPKKASYLTFAAVFLVEPSRDRESGEQVGGGETETIDIWMAGYYYSALKAKKIRGNIPFTKWDEVESLVTFGLQGPAGQKLYSDGRYEVAAAYPLGEVKLQDRWVALPDAKALRGPFAVPGSQLVTFRAKTHEASKMKEKLEELAEKVGELTPEDLGIKNDDDEQDE